MSRTDGAAASIAAGIQPPAAYDYERQCWLEMVVPTPAGPNFGAWLWRVRECGHPHREIMGRPCCYAGSHAGEVVPHHEEVH